MSGPSTKRENINTAPFPEMTPQVQDFLKNLLSDPSGGNLGLFGGQAGLGGSGQFSLFQGNPGVSVNRLAEPIFQRNLEFAQDTQREFGGPRFSAEAGRQNRLLAERALQDFNLFQQQNLQAGQNTALAANAQRLGFLGPLLQQGLVAGGAGSPPVFTQNPGSRADILGAVGAVGGILPFL
jgi:hypothetical protein